MMKLRNLRGVAIAASLACAALAANANTFNCVAGATADCNAGETSLSWTWDGTNFTIKNNGSVGSVTEVYFDLSAGMTVSFAGGTGGSVYFQDTKVSPGALSGAPASFSSDKGFDSDKPAPKGSSLDPGETATFTITGANADSFMDGLLAAGIHVRSLVTGQSGSFITNGESGGGGTDPVSPVPEAETYAMWLLGLGVVGWTARRRKASKAE